MVTVRRVRVLKKKSDNRLEELLHSLSAEQQRMTQEEREKQMREMARAEAEESQKRVNSIIDEIFTKHKLVAKAEEPEETLPECKEADKGEVNRPAESVGKLLEILRSK